MERWHGVLRQKIFNLMMSAGRKRLKDREEPPLRSDLLSTDQLAQYAKALAGQHEVDKRAGPNESLAPKGKCTTEAHCFHERSENNFEERQ